MRRDRKTKGKGKVWKQQEVERQEKEEELLSRAGSISNFSKWLEEELPADVLRMEAELGGTLLGGTLSGAGLRRWTGAYKQMWVWDKDVDLQ